ncbi:MAG: hypothetical protein HUU01_21710, partial [Saprospiraceae bacterium]|nr:hypothetical protein [Saprospiraceae bacterium]
PNYRLAEWAESPCDTFNFQQTDDSFQRIQYDKEFAHPHEKRGYTVLPGIKTADCKGCTEEQLKILQNPFEFVKYRIEYLETGVIPKVWAELPAEGEVIKSLLTPRKE